ncbi:MAG: hypothetical protein M3N23_07720, partial [Pseudomonadota bacterium]|nr:hypothetical protein [Pseudomonadota bacterium]
MPLNRSIPATLLTFALVAGAVMSYSQPAQARARRTAVAAPQITNLAVAPPNQLTPGSDLTITL